MPNNQHIHPVDDFFGQIGEVEAGQAIPLDNGELRVETSPLELRNSVFNDDLRSPNVMPIKPGFQDSTELFSENWLELD